MTFTSRHAIAALIVFGLLSAALMVPLGASPEAADAAETSATGCKRGLTLSTVKRKARRNGWVRVRGRVCGASNAAAARGARVRINLRRPRGWAVVARAVVRADGSFSTCVPLRVTRRSRIARLRARAPNSSRSGPVRVRVSNRGPRACKKPRPRPSPTEAGNPDCPLSQLESKVGLTLPESCSVVASDTASNPNPIPFWGSIDCQNASRHQLIGVGGDPSPTAAGGPQGNTSFRRTTVLDGDDFWGERCELGQNDHRYSPVAFYREGHRRITYASFRLPNGFPLQTDKWQGVLQMKQAQPADNGGGTPVLSLSAFAGKWSLWHSHAGWTTEDHKLWETPAQTGTWTRFAIDAFYSQHADKGWVKVYVDLNGDGDFADAGEQSPTFRTNTLKREIAGDATDGLTAGQSIPSHLRVGIYHHQDIACPAPTGCRVEVDNVQVLKP